MRFTLLVVNFFYDIQNMAVSVLVEIIVVNDSKYFPLLHPNWILV